MTIDAPKAYFLDKMSYPTAFVVKKANAESVATWWLNPLGYPLLSKVSIQR